MSDLMIRRAGNRVFVTGVVLLCIWVLLPIWLLFVNALSAPSEVTAFPKSLIPSFDLASLSFFFGFAEVLDALWNSVQVPGRPDQRDERRRIVQAADLVVVYRNPTRRRINKNAISAWSNISGGWNGIRKNCARPRPFKSLILRSMRS